ncbi:hypothetical protein BCR42DRAFT_410771 [Absidia repens]|uniref:EF-hand domain-containing protein n=1 Tax=Absidia repens TaxID=90262 RepID=A0A1X2IQY4_9FUNG|nr:hypothetical protein BCR42DRAFT_410771 [Absidia repens]
MDNTHHIEISDEVTFFKLHDLDRDGYWNDHEVRAIYGLERDVSSDASHVNTIVWRAFQDLDSDKDGLISMKEYMVHHLPDWTEEEIKVERQWRLTHSSNSMDNNGNHAQHPIQAVDGHDDEPAATWEDHEDDDENDSEQVPDIHPGKYKALWT